MILLSGFFLLGALSFALLGILLVIGVHKRIKRTSHGTLDQITPHFRPVEIAELQELLNFADEGYLRLNLTPRQFRTAQNDRILLTLEYFGRMSHNVGLLYQWATYAFMRSSKSFNREARQASRELVDLCAAFRSVSWTARLKLQLWLLRTRLLPFTSIPCLAEVRAVRNVDLVYTYERIKATAVTLCRACGADEPDELPSSL